MYFATNTVQSTEKQKSRLVIFVIVWSAFYLV